MSQTHETPTPLLLAGGRSRRMGRDKRLLRIDDRALVRRAYDELREAFGPPRVLVADQASAEEIACELPADVQFFLDDPPGGSPLRALAGALRRIETSYAFLLACDLPAMHGRALRNLWEASVALAPRPSAYVPSAEGFAQVTCAIYHRDLAVPLHVAAGRGESCLWHGLRSLGAIYVASAEVWPVGLKEHMFRNINTARDYEAFVAQRSG